MKHAWLFLMLCPAISFANDWNVQDMKTKSSDSAAKDSGVYAVSQKQFQDDITVDQDIDKLTLTEEQLHQAKVWALSESDEKRYVLLMQNRSSVYYKSTKLSPTEILGLNARTEEERERYATLAAEQNEQQIAELLAWRNAYQKAYKDRIKDIPVIKSFDSSPFSPYHYQAIDLKSGDKLYFYLRITDPVKAQLAVIYHLLENTPNTELNIYFIGNDVDKASINSWAKAHSLPLSLVKQKRIILNAGHSSDLNKINQSGETLPLIVHSSKGKTSIVKMSRF